VNSIGIAIERRGEQLYATQDFSASVMQMSREEQEQQVSRLLQANGLSVIANPDEARRSCDQNHALYTTQPVSISRFETSDLSRLPNELARMATNGHFRRASGGACEVPTVTPFARFRLTVVLYQYLSARCHVLVDLQRDSAYTLCHASDALLVLAIYGPLTTVAGGVSVSAIESQRFWPTRTEWAFFIFGHN